MVQDFVTNLVPGNMSRLRTFHARSLDVKFNTVAEWRTWPQ